MSDVYSVDRFSSEESNNAVQDLYWIVSDISSEGEHKPELAFWPFQISNFCAQLAVLDLSLNLCYRFDLLNENNANISKSPSSLNIAVWEPAMARIGHGMD